MKQALFESLGIVGIVLLLAVASVFWHPNAPAWYTASPVKTLENELSIEKARDPKWAAALWVDARSTKDYTVEHRREALSLNDENFEDQLWENSEEFTDLDRLIIVYCDGLDCQRSTKIAQLLRERLQLRQVYVLKGDWKAL